MQALPPAELSRIQVCWAGAPDTVEPGSGFDAFAIVVNEAASVLTSLGDYPVHLSYHWYGPDGLVLWEGVRTELYPPLPPGCRFRYRLQVTAPILPGIYTLQLTVVQESVAWLDSTSVCSDSEGTVCVANYAEPHQQGILQEANPSIGFRWNGGDSGSR